MKLKRILIFAIALLLTLGILFTTACLLYSPLRYRAKLYSYCNEWVDPTFLESNKLSVPYENPDYNENEEESAQNPMYVGDSSLPSNRTFLITDEKTFKEIFTASPIKVNFEKEMVVLYMFGSNSTTSKNYKIAEIEVEDGSANIYYKLDQKIWGGRRKDAVQTWHRCMVIKMKKLNVSAVNVIKSY